MATRRTAPTVIPSGGSPTSNALSEKPDGNAPSDVTPAVPMSVIAKLLLFTLAMVCAPLGTYFLTVDAVFSGNATFAGGSAALVANVVLIAYVLVAMREDQGEMSERERKKGL